MCFSFAWFGQILIWAIIIGAALAILKLIVEFVIPRLGFPLAADVVALFSRIIMILIWAFILVFIVVVVFDIIACLIGAGGGMPRLQHGSLLLPYWA